MIAIFSIALVVAMVAVILSMKKISSLNEEKSELASKNAGLLSEKAVLEEKLKFQEEHYSKLEALRLEHEKALNEERNATFESQRKQMEESIKGLIHETQAELRTKNATSMLELIKPLKDKFGEFDKTVRESMEKDAEREGRISEMIKILSEQSKSIGDEARNFADALSGRSKLQGNMGEMMLTTILVRAGLKEGVHFDAQSVLRDENGHEIKSESGSTMIPDVVIYYPDNTEVVVDSKLSLTAYTRYCAANTVEERNRWAREHVKSVENHVDELKKKDYASYIPEGKKKTDFNIMFMPIEGAFQLMLEEDPELWQRARDAKVLIVSQMNLIIVLNMIMMTWKQYDQEKNLEKVFATASELMSQLRAWMEAFVDVGKSLDKAKDAYDGAKKKLCDSRQSVVKKIEKLEGLNIGPKRQVKGGVRMIGVGESVIPKELAEYRTEDFPKDSPDV